MTNRNERCIIHVEVAIDTTIREPSPCGCRSFVTPMLNGKRTKLSRLQFSGYSGPANNRKPNNRKKYPCKRGAGPSKLAGVFLYQNKEMKDFGRKKNVCKNDNR